MKLHPRKGVNPRITVCRFCDAEVGVALVGDSDLLYRCPTCRVEMLGIKTCPTCKRPGEYIRELPDGARLPIEVCDGCVAKQAERDREVAAGGVHFRCSDCGSEGVVKANTDAAMEIRCRIGVPPPASIGVILTKKECPLCLDQGEPPP